MTTFTVDRVIPAPPERVWTAWTTVPGLAAWWWRHLPDTVCEVDLRIGGAYSMINQAAGIGVHGRYLALDPPRTFAATWVWSDDGVDGPTEQIEVTLQACSEGTQVSIVHRGGWVDAEPVENYRLGWHSVLDALAGQAEAGTNFSAVEL
jgi:uncharacterized protein YndB with AHSA1/START domain